MNSRSLAAILAVALVGTSHAGCTPAASPPNILLIVLDTVRADAVGREWKQRPVTPQMDRIALEGWRFANAYATAPWTLPSHASMFTGLAPSQHGAVHEHFTLGPEHPTLAEILARHGYATHGITSNPWVTAERGLARGFGRFEKAYSDVEAANDKGAARATQLAIDFIARASREDKPFFLFVNYLEAHLPYAPPDAGFEALGIEIDSLSRREFTIEQAEEIIAGKRAASADELALARTLYLGEIAYQDQQLGKLLDALRKRNLLDETLVIITADHGELLGDQGLMGHEFSLSDDLLRVPLVLRYPPRLPARQTVTLPVSHLDLLPTVLDVLGESEIPVPLEGKSLLASEAISPERALIAEYSQPVTLLGQYWAARHPDFDSEAYAVSLRSLRKGTRKLVENSRGEVTLIELDLNAATSDGNDLAREIVTIEMRKELASWITRLKGVEEPLLIPPDGSDSSLP